MKRDTAACGIRMGRGLVARRADGSQGEGRIRTARLPAGRASGGSVEGRLMRLALLALALLAACVIVQSAGMLLLIHWLARVRHVLESPSVPRRIGLLLRLFVWIVLLHLIQIGLWAVVFWRAHELPTLETAVYFSLATYTTIGFGDVVLGPGWRVLAGIEGLAGLLLVGWSTAFVFAVVNRMYEHWRRVHEAS